jgi:anti-sigma factor RsiW
LDDYLDEELTPDARWELEAHLQYCESCQATLARGRQLQQALSTYPVKAPTPGFFDRAMEEAARGRAQPPRSGPWTIRYAGALAAGIAVLAVGGLFLHEPELADNDAVAGVSMVVHETRTINLVFASASELEGVSLTVALPDGVELAEYRGLDEVSWTTRLHPGKNVLPLELVAIGGSGGELVARLQHDGDEKVFTVSVAVI